MPPITVTNDDPAVPKSETVPPKGEPVLRFDSGELGKAETTPEGWLKVPASIARTGVYEYLNQDGTIRRELRTPEEVFDSEALRSIALRPVTDDHPWAEMPPLLTPKNTRQYQRGSAGELVKRSGDFVETTLMITDAELISKIQGGMQEVSAGYLARTVFEPGVYKGKPYDCRQEKIRVNHIAIVQKGRAGDDVRLRLDSGAALAIRRISDDVEPIIPEIPEGSSMADLKKLDLGGVDYEVSEQVAQAVGKLITDQKARIDSVQAKLDAGQKCDKCGTKLDCGNCGKSKTDAVEKAVTDIKTELSKEKARADMAESKLKDAEKAHADALDPKRVAELVKARVALESRAQEILGADAKLDALDDQGVKRAVLTKLSPDVKLDGKDAVYVDAAYDYAIANVGKQGLAALRTATAPRLDGKGGDEVPDARAAKARMEEEARNAWKRPAKDAA